MTDHALTPAERRKLRGPPKRSGYAHIPGTGPEGETCGTCKHKIAMRGRFLKCELRYETWTHGYGTDILARSPACKFWSARDEAAGD